MTENGTPQVQLLNPVSHQFSAFIFGNATACTEVVQQDSAFRKHIVICGAGPSLADEAEQYCRDFDQLWGCNSALTWLIDNGYEPTHGFTIDQTPHMVGEWYDRPDVDYLVASTIHPHLTEHLLEAQRRLIFFHNFVGIKERAVEYHHCEACEMSFQLHEDADRVCVDCGAGLVARYMHFEDWLYTTLFPPTARVGAGLNSVSRAIDLALFMGADPITVLGADCALRVKRPPPHDAIYGSPEHKAWLHDCVMHADGSDALRSGASMTTVGAEIDGRWWETKVDMAITASHLVMMQRYYDDRVRLIGDTLPNALMGKPDEFLKRLPNMEDSYGELVPYTPPDGLTDTRS